MSTAKPSHIRHRLPISHQPNPPGGLAKEGHVDVPCRTLQASNARNQVLGIQVLQGRTWRTWRIWRTRRKWMGLAIHSCRHRRPTYFEIFWSKFHDLKFLNHLKSTILHLAMQQWARNINRAGMMAAPCSLVLLVVFGTNQLVNQSLRTQLVWNGDASSIHAPTTKLFPTTNLFNRRSVNYTFQHMPFKSSKSLFVQACGTVFMWCQSLSCSLQATVIVSSWDRTPSRLRDCIADVQTHGSKPQLHRIIITDLGKPGSQGTQGTQGTHHLLAHHGTCWHKGSRVSSLPRDIWIWIFH